MTKDEILQRNWIKYLRYWATEVKEVTEPPNEERFWLWYALHVLDVDRPTEDDDIFIE